MGLLCRAQGGTPVMWDLRSTPGPTERTPGGTYLATHLEGFGRVWAGTWMVLLSPSCKSWGDVGSVTSRGLLEPWVGSTRIKGTRTATEPICWGTDFFVMQTARER